MPRRIPTLRLHKPSHRAVVTLRDASTGEARDFYCGPWGTPESHETYARLIRGWKANGYRLPGEADVTEDDDGFIIEDLIVAFWKHASGYYAGGELAAFHSVLRILRRLCGRLPVQDFNPLWLEKARDTMIARGWGRRSINRQVGRIRQVFCWGVTRGLVGAPIADALAMLPALRRGKTKARETEPVRPVPQDMIDATLPHLSAPLRALVQVQLLTGARSDELCRLRPCDLDRSGRVWIYRMTGDHKTAHHGLERTIYIGPRGQVFLEPLLASRPPASYVFSPHDAQGKASTAARATRYTTATYRRALHRACDAAFPPPDELARKRIEAPGRKRTRWETAGEWRDRLGPDAWSKLQQWRRDHRWSPHQLRHAAATNLSREFGMELARIILGHTTVRTTAQYAERDEGSAIEAMLRVG